MQRRTLSVLVMAVAMAMCCLVCLSQERGPEGTSKPSPDAEQAARATARGRAADILDELALTDKAKVGQVRDIIVAFYVKRISWGPNDDRIRQLTGQLVAAERDSDLAKADDLRKQLAALSDELAAMRAKLLADLGKVLTAEQVQVVKDVMTYKKLPLLLNAYSRKNALTGEQKAVVLRLLTEAREEAMVAGSSQDKHAMFNKAAGRVNIYLDAQKKLATLLGDIHSGRFDQAEGALRKLENGRQWLKEAMAGQLAQARKALQAARAGAATTQTQPTQPACD